MHLRTCGPQITKSPKIANPQSVILRKVHKSNKLLNSANLRICDLRNLFADRPPLLAKYCYLCSSQSSLSPSLWVLLMLIDQQQKTLGSKNENRTQRRRPKMYES